MTSNGFSKDLFNPFFELVLRKIESLDLAVTSKYELAESTIAKLNYFIYFALIQNRIKNGIDPDLSVACQYLFESLNDENFFTIKSKLTASLETVANLIIRNLPTDSAEFKIKQKPNSTLNLEKFSAEFCRRYFPSAQSDNASEISMLLDNLEKDQESSLLLRKITEAYQSYDPKDCFHSGDDKREIYSHTNIGTNLQKQCTSSNAGWVDRVPWMLKFLMNKTPEAPLAVVEKTEQKLPYSGTSEFRVYCGPPGTGKTTIGKLEALKFAGSMQSNVSVVQFHPSYTYQQFIEGLAPILFSDGTTRYQVTDGPLLIQSAKASGTWVKTLIRIVRKVSGKVQVNFPIGLLERYSLTISDILLKIDEVEIETIPASGGALEIDPTLIKHIFAKRSSAQFLEASFRGKNWGEGTYCLVIDELNRGNVAQIFGELLYAISETEAESTLPVQLQYSGRNFVWPKSLSLIATMNTADRSTDELDQALKRRFKFIEILPDPIGLSPNGDSPFLTADIKAIYESDPAKIKGSYRPSKACCDFVAATFNSLADRKELSCVIPPFSGQLDSLNKIINTSDEILDRHSRRIGHSHFINIARRISKKLCENNSTELDKVFEFFLRSLHEEVYPQLLSIASGDEVVANGLFKRWQSQFAELSKSWKPLELAS